MINQLGQVMVYVNDQDKAVRFWTEKAGFQVLEDQEEGGMRWIEIAPANQTGSTIVLHDKEIISRMSPELNLGTPSLMFFTEDLDQLYNDFKNKNVTVGEIVEMTSTRVFNFSDEEENYFAVMEK
ncbi:VOC family protein [Halobacillus massiliensis]|uniref:VOC family protein n=1 Tax=Halobacillus massiliensis TaxID=1926286 RepID=UPI0009E632CF|nr:VOC family protein [Halobacillus massiliensis]